jgi:hypothetical protein
LRWRRLNLTNAFLRGVEFAFERWDRFGSCGLIETASCPATFTATSDRRWSRQYSRSSSGNPFQGADNGALSGSFFGTDNVNPADVEID